MIFALIINAAIFLLAHALAARALRVREISPYRFRFAQPRAPWTREIAVRSSGVVAIYVFAVILFATTTRIVGASGTRVKVQDGYPAAIAGVRDGDRIVEVDGVPTKYWGTIYEHVAASGPHGSLVLKIERTRRTSTVAVTLNDKGMLGVRSSEHVDVGLIDAFAGGVVQPFRVVGQLIQSFRRAVFDPPEVETVGGPLMIVREEQNQLAALFAGIATYSASALPLFAAYAVMLTLIDLFTRIARR